MLLAEELLPAVKPLAARGLQVEAALSRPAECGFGGIKFAGVATSDNREQRIANRE